MERGSYLEVNKIGLSVVIPSFQSEMTLGRVVRDLHATLKAKKIVKFEILLILDGPRDGTKKIAKELEAQFSQCRVIELTRNFGQHAAIYAGIHSSKYGLIATMDDDGQHPASAIPLLIAEMSPEVDIVYGTSLAEKHGAVRKIASRFFKIVLFRILGVGNAREISALRLFRRSLLQSVDLQKISVGVIDVPLHWNSTRISTVAVQMSERAEGKSNYDLRSLSRFAIQMIISFSVKPLKFALLLGLLGFFASSILTIFYLYQYVTGRIEVAGFTTITILITTMASIQLITLGVLGEYVGSIHQKSMGKPLFNIKES